MRRLFFSNLNLVYKFSHLHISTGQMHSKCRSGFYPGTQNKIERASVPDGKVDWNVPFNSYTPVQFTSPHILRMPSYADPEISARDFTPAWNIRDGKINRQSHEGDYDIVDGLPRNPHGRTGITGRGCLGRWGPNHAADPIVTRWKREKQENVTHAISGKPILEFVCIQRGDCGQWAIPGGMVDPGEKVTTTLQREFLEEAVNSHEMTDDQKVEVEALVKKMFSEGEDVYSGYVDDPRNTDNAWMETVACNFHSETAEGIMSSLQLEAGDDAKAVKWVDISRDLDLYANHRDFIEKVAVLRRAHW